MKQSNFIYTFAGFGAGKTRAAFGTALRSISNSENVLVIQFLKSPTTFKSGEVEICKDSFPTMDIYQFGLDKITLPHNIMPDDIVEVKKAWNFMLDKLSNKKYDLLVLDEILPTLSMGLLDKNLFITTVKSLKYNGDADIILTGRLTNRDLENSIWDISDFYTELNMKKHPFNKICPVCKTEYRYSDAFCAQCGTALTGGASAKKGREF